MLGLHYVRVDVEWIVLPSSILFSSSFSQSQGDDAI